MAIGRSDEHQGRNSVDLEGELAKDAEVRTLPSGSTLAVLTLRIPLTAERLTSIPVTVWDPARSVVDARGGRRVTVTGRIVRRFWRGADGTALSRVEVVADKVRVR